jgi:hypothetical protein
MLIASLIFVLSFTAMIRFTVLSWRAGLLTVAAQPLAFESDLLADLSRKALNSGSFQEISSYQKLCPSFGQGSGLRTVGAYYRVLQVATHLGTAASSWAQNEMATCTRYAAVQLSQRLANTQVLATEMGSY